jgi:3-oxoacyl-[acyl-carrier-protein] synthase II
MNRVAVTGLGAVSPLGLGIRENWINFINQKSGFAAAEFPGSQAFQNPVCGVIKDFNVENYISSKRLLKLMNRESQLLAAAADQALKDSMINNEYQPEKTGIFIGTGLTSGELESLIPLVENSIDEEGNFSYKLLGSKAISKCSPLLSFKILPNMPLSYVSILFNIQGQNMVFNPWSGNTAQAIGEAMRAIQNGEIDCAFAGGTDSKNHYVGFMTFSSLGFLSNGDMVPFSYGSKGFILSEGSAVAVLENLDSARKRGAHIYAELKGYSTLTDHSAENYLSNDSVILEESMRDAISNAGLAVNDIDIILSGANAIPRADYNEACAIEKVFKDYKPFISGTKQYTGEMLAASSAYDFCIGAYSLSEDNDELPLLNLNTSEKQHLSDHAKGKINLSYRRNILINSFELGNSKTCLILGKNQ